MFFPFQPNSTFSVALLTAIGSEERAKFCLVTISGTGRKVERDRAAEQLAEMIVATAPEPLREKYRLSLFGCESTTPEGRLN